MQTVSRSSFTTVTTEGAILPADLLQRVVDGRSLEGLRPEDYHLAPSERLNEAISRSWNRLLGVWEGFDEQRKDLPEDDRGTTLTRERWLLILLQELGYGRLPFQGNMAIDGEDEESAKYPISHEYDHVPLHLITFRQPLDRADGDRAEHFRRSPHSLLQEFLNRSDRHLWGIVSNGLRLRLLRDNVSFTRAAYLEFDLEAMMAGELYADFTLLWLTAHQSRLEGAPESCWLEKWSQEAAEQGTRALDSLRDGVQEAISILGRGFLAHGANGELREQLRSGALSTADYYRQLLRLVYRLIFLFVAEDRNLLLVQETEPEIRARYYGYYSLTRLRELAARRRSGPHPDLYRTLRLVMALLREGYPTLGLPGLGSYLFSERSTPSLDTAEIANETLLDAIRALAFTIENRVLRPVDYKNLGAEELGSVYESLLELHPELNVAAATFDLRTAAGSERKTTGSYYTPTSLINSLLDTALEPVVADRLRGKRGKEAEAALLDIKVVDPAAGSGHFLIAAANRLVRHLARVRTGDEEPSPEASRLALRDVVRQCIYGVDINEMAVELCKVGLWLETLDPGKPLSFLEANIQCGNSLLGATPALLARGIPDEAFTPITGDDKAYCTEWKKRNREQRKGQLDMFARGVQPWERLGNFAQAMRALETMAGDTVADVARQQAEYQRLVGGSDYEYGKLWADAWAAAFVWRKRPEGKPAADGQDGWPYPITEQVFREIERSPHTQPKWLKDEIQRLADEYQFFHWHLEFPQVFTPREDLTGLDEGDVTGWNGGFDVVLGNPPWEKVKVQEKEWFASRNFEIANENNASIREKKIKKLKLDHPLLYGEFQNDKRRAEGESHFIRRSARYPLGARGDLNTYPLFVELGELAINPRGRVGLIVKTGILADFNMRAFFAHFVERGHLVSAYDFSNKNLIFKAVVANERFTLLTLTGDASASDHFEVSILNEDISSLQKKIHTWTLTPKDISLINPNTKTCPLFQTQKDAIIIRAIYQKLAVLIKEDANGDINPWNCIYYRMFDMSNDSKLFHDMESLQKISSNQATTLWETGNGNYLPLLEGKLFDSDNYRHGDFRGIPKDKRFGTKAEPNHPSLRDLTDPTYEGLPRYWVHASEVLKWFESKHLQHPNGVLTFRDVCRTHTDSRTVRATITPAWGAGNKAPLILFSDSSREESAKRSLLLQSNMTTFVFDYVARQKFSGGSLNKYILIQLPFIPPYNSQCHWHTTVTIFEWLTCRALELNFPTWALRKFAQDCGYHGPPFRWDEERRFLLRCELDAAYFHLYGINREDVVYIMDTFPIVRRKDEAAFGEYRTKRVILEIYDEMAAASQPGSHSYQTRLDPPPAHPDAAHPWDTEYLGPELPREKWWQAVDDKVTTAEGRGWQGDKVTSSHSVTPAPGHPVTKEPAPTFMLKSPPAKPSPPETKKPARSPQPSQPALVTDFTPPQGNRNQRLKQVMALGDRVKTNRQDANAIAQLVAALGDSDDSIRWLAGSALKLLSGYQVVATLGAFLEQEPEQLARGEAVKILKLIVDTEEDESVREAARKVTG